MTWLYLGVWSALCVANTAVAAVQQPAEQAQWQLSGDAFQCQLQQQISGLGQVRFILNPGQPLQLQLSLAQPHDALEQVSVAARGADWQAASAQWLSERYVAELYHHSQASFIKAALPLLQQIQAGAWLHFSVGNASVERTLLLSSTHPARAVADFQGCVAKMAPLSWQQARQHELYFNTGRYQLDAEQLQWLAKLARYIALDRKVTKILLDGHTDDIGTTLANRLLSQQRADEVAAQLLELGVPATMLEVRAHGNRYPLQQSRGTAEANNRRVSLRLIRTTELAGANKP
ncbi:MAG: OmpA family protein [Gammaproteobacteria bacterium]|nr:OmpA family protein [Gammaproteobacteria bacterium]MBU1553334.1 OmpA family protein [Gammaproteobacteria bacterium]MBU2070778.1 OmpA family protein [Gammaproteobacteria bacterium]MBU2182769.1 OmpA family protein [Gammaproteobacteria bacterium]MBU2205989.1 OmpA family protein [Gammaproteobacteria bacterium]